MPEQIIQIVSTPVEIETSPGVVESSLGFYGLSKSGTLYQLVRSDDEENGNPLVWKKIAVSPINNK